MPYDFQVDKGYMVDAGWFYFQAANLGAFDDAQWDAAIAQTGIADRADAINSLVMPQLTALGFQVGDWSILELTEDYLDYQGFPLIYGEYYIAFSIDSIATEDGANLPDSITTNFTDPAKQLVNALGITMGEFAEPITLISIIREDREEEDPADAP